LAIGTGQLLSPILLNSNSGALFSVVSGHISILCWCWCCLFFACNKLFLHSDVVDIVPVLLKRDEDPAVAAFHVQELFSRATERYCDVPRPECYYLSIF
jgi:hypothetical protein